MLHVEVFWYVDFCKHLDIGKALLASEIQEIKMLFERLVNIKGE